MKDLFTLKKNRDVKALIAIAAEENGNGAQVMAEGTTGDILNALCNLELHLINTLKMPKSMDKKELLEKIHETVMEDFEKGSKHKVVEDDSEEETEKDLDDEIEKGIDDLNRMLGKLLKRIERDLEDK